MPATVTERFESRRVVMGNNPTVELNYLISGETSDVAARVALEAASAVAYDLYGNTLFLLPRESVSVSPLDDDLWEGTVRYGIVPAESESTFAFETGGGTQHITQSLSTSGSYVESGDAPDHEGAIGVTNDSVEGVDIAVPAYSFSETHYLAPAAVDGDYKAALSLLTGSVNDDTWRGFAAGEVLFLGAAGTKRGFGPWEITYRFSANKNITNKTIGSITGINKKGWEYLWVRYQDAEDGTAHAIVKKPVAVYVEKVYPDGDFEDLGIGV